MNLEKNKVIRLGGSLDSYKKPPKTLQETLTKDQIKEYLKEYRQVDIKKEEIAMNKHIRYFSLTEDNRKLFRLGGFLKKYDKEKGYIVLSNNKNSWCVNTNTSILYKKIGFEDYMKLKGENEILKKYIQKHKNNSL